MDDLFTTDTNGSGARVPPPTIVGRGLLVSGDQDAIRTIGAAVQRFAITTEACADPAIAARLISRRKFEAIVVDLTLGKPAYEVFERIKDSPSNHTSVTIALVESCLQMRSTVQPKFVMQKPLSDDLVERTLRAALGLIIRDHRRYFRYPVLAPAVVHIEDGVEFACETLNISENGLAISIPVALRPGLTIRAMFTLPDEENGFEINAEICWSANGKAGMEFRSVAIEQKQRLANWLSRKIEEGLPKEAQRLFEKV